MKVKKILLAAVVSAIALPPSGSLFAQGLALEEIVVKSRKDSYVIEDILSVKKNTLSI